MEKKEVKQQVKKEFLLNILIELKAGLNPSQISIKLSISKQKLNYYIQILKNQGLIKKVGYGTWEVNNEQVKKSSLGWNDKPTTNLHAFQINFPILEGKIDDTDWKIKEKLNNWTPKYISKEVMGGIVIKNNNNKSLTVWLETRDIANLNEVYDLAFKIRIYIYELFKKEGVILDPFNCETKNLDIGTSDKNSESMLNKGEKFKLDLNKKSEKIFPKDNIDASAWLDGSPYKFTAETNDLEWKREYLRMPFSIRDLRTAVFLMEDYNKNLLLHTKVQKEQLRTQKAIQKLLGDNSIKKIKDNLTNGTQTKIDQF